MLPVEEKLAEVSLVLSANRNVVLTAPPGSGKTTCVPLALLDEPWLKGRRILMLEPRRLAARNCAAHMARKRGERLGETIGYQVRLERKISTATRLEVVTEGLLTQRILSDPELQDVGLIIFDEFHERSLQCDLAFALALDVRRALRPDLRLLVMSATLDTSDVSSHLGDATVVRAEGQMFPVSTVYLGDVSVSSAIAMALGETEGDILCFLPGESEIRRLMERFPEALPLYGALSKGEQDRVFAPSAQRKLILSTSIAETSVTLEGVTCVIDSGLMRVSRFSPASGMSGLVTLPVTQDRAEQRRGRAGRVRPGVCYRLWTEASHASRAKRMLPEILDADLSSIVLLCASWGACNREDLPWLTSPPAGAWDQAKTLLKTLGALDERGMLTSKGRAMASLALHPRLANMILGGGDPLLAAVLEEGTKSRETDIRSVTLTPRMRELARRFEAQSSRFVMKRLPVGSEGRALALAYPDRIAKNRGNGSFRMASGRGAVVSPEDPLAKEPYIVCCDLDDRPGNARIFRACPIDKRELLDLFAGQIREEPFCEWDRRNDCVRCVVQEKLGELTLSERTSEDVESTARAIVEGIRIKGVANLPCWTKETFQLRSRINFIARVCEGWPQADDAAILGALPGFIDGFTKWHELEKLDLGVVLDFILSRAGHDRRELDRLAPVKMAVPSGSNMTIHYEGDEPMVSVRLQECFGLMETPKVAGGRVPIVMTLLSPAQRPVQITKDLAGFWRTGYQHVRKDLRGRYPRHYWPEDPLTAVATHRVRPKGA